MGSCDKTGPNHEEEEEQHIRISWRGREGQLLRNKGSHPDEEEGNTGNELGKESGQWPCRAGVSPKLRKNSAARSAEKGSALLNLRKEIKGVGDALLLMQWAIE